MQINRRQLFGLVAAGMSASVVAKYLFNSKRSKRQLKDGHPNVLLITSDDLSPSLGCYGDKQIRTPNLDRLAAEGVRFENSFVTQASCSSSRSSIFSGLYPHQNGQIGLSHLGYSMNKDIPTLPAILQQAGYKTGALGKIHVKPRSALPFDFRGNWQIWLPKLQRKLGLIKAKEIVDRDVSLMAKLATNFIREEAEKPFFLLMSYFDPHRPFINKVKGIPHQLFQPNDVKLFDFLGIDTPKLRQQMARYYNCVTRVDYGVGLLLEALEKAGHADDTLVIFIGDHGADFPRAKKTCYEAGLRIPFLVRWPGQVNGGIVSSELVSTVDILPTLLDAVGIDLDVPLPGRSLLKLISGKTVTWRKTLCAEFTAHGPADYFPSRCIRDERYKLITNLLPNRVNPSARIPAKKSQLPEFARLVYDTYLHPPTEELYDLQEDQNEFNNLAGREQYKDIQERLRSQLLQWREQTDDPLLDPDKLAALTHQHSTSQS